MPVPVSPSSSTVASRRRDLLDRAADPLHLRIARERCRGSASLVGAPAAGGSRSAARAAGTRARWSAPGARARTAWRRSRRRPARSPQRVGAIVLARQHDDLGVRRERVISSSSLKPSYGSSGRGGRPRSIVTTAGSCRRSCASALSRSSATHGLVAGRTPSSSASAAPGRPRRSAAAALVAHGLPRAALRRPSLERSAGGASRRRRQDGSSKRTGVPSPGVLSTSMRPPSSGDVLVALVGADAHAGRLVVWNGLNRRSRTNSGAHAARRRRRPRRRAKSVRSRRR